MSSPSIVTGDSRMGADCGASAINHVVITGNIPIPGDPLPVNHVT